MSPARTFAAVGLLCAAVAAAADEPKPAAPPIPRNRIAHDGTVSSIAFSPDGETVAVASGVAVRLWDVKTCRVRATFEGRGRAAFSPDGRLLASGGGGDAVRVWDVLTGKEKVAFKTGTEQAASLAFSPDGRTLAAATGIGTTLWDVPTGRARVFRTPFALQPVVSFSPDGKTLAVTSAGNDSELFSVPSFCKFWDVATGNEVAVPEGLIGVAFSPDGKTVAGVDRGRIRVWELKTGKERPPFGGTARLFTAVAFSPDGKTLATEARVLEGGFALGDPRTGTRVMLWDVATGTEVGVVEGYAGGAAFSPNGKTVAAVSGATVRFIDVATGREHGGLGEHEKAVRAVAFSPDGKTVASASNDGRVKMWDLKTGREDGGYRGHQGRATSVAFSPDGKILASTGGDGRIPLWDGSLVRPVLRGHPGGGRASPTAQTADCSPQVATTGRSGSGTQRS